KLEAGRAVFELDLGPGCRTSLFVEVHCTGDVPSEPPGELFPAALRRARRELRVAAGRAVSIETSNEIFNEAARRSVADLYTLTTTLPEGSVPYAGIPWFSTVFGRDAIITALETLWLDPSIARGVLAYLSAHQATERDDAADAEPGKILHE